MRHGPIAGRKGDQGGSARAPVVVRVIVGAERDRQAGALEVLKNLGKIGVKVLLKVEGGQMKVTAAREKRQVEVGGGRARDGTGTSGCGAPRGRTEAGW